MQEALPRAATIRAAIRLLGDDDRSVVDSCRRRLLSWGSLAISELELAATEESDPRVRASARSILRSLEIELWSREFTLFVESWRRNGDEVELLAEGLVRVSRLLGGVGSDPDRVRNELAVTPRRLAPLVAGRTSTTAARHLGAFLSRTMRLRGGGNLAPERRHVRPEHVLHSGPGTSALLTVIALVVARRAGLDVTAVRLPDFFLVRVHGRRRVLVDPYHDGRTVTRSDCLRFLRSRVVGVPHSTYLADVGDEAVLFGLLEDVLRAHDPFHHGDLRRALRRAMAALGHTARTQPS